MIIQMIFNTSSIMKIIFKATFAIVLASMLFFSCSKEENVEKKDNLVTITFSANKAGIETKTAAVVGETSVSYIWTSEDIANIKLFKVNADGAITEEVSNPTVTKVSDTKLTISAEVEANASYIFRAILCDSDNYTGSGDNYATRKPRIAANQNPNGRSNFDPNADILVSEDKTVNVSANGSTTGAMELIFHRQVVVNKMTLKNLTPGEKVKKVVISSDKDLTGYLENGSMAGQYKEITIRYNDEIVPEGGLFPVYFLTMENTEQTLSVSVVTDQNTYSKSFTRTIDFTLGEFTQFNVALPSGTPISDLSGYYLILASHSDDNWYLMTSSEHSNHYFIGENSNVSSSTVETPAYSNFSGISDIHDFIWKLEANGDSYNIRSMNTGRYLALTTNSANVASAVNMLDSENSSNFTISISSNNSAVVNSVRFVDRNLKWNKTSPRFAFYTTEQTGIYLVKATYSNQEPVCPPVFSLESGLVEANTTVSLSCQTEGAVIYYTTDDSEFSTSTWTQGNTVTINATKTVRAIAIKNGMRNSLIETRVYNVPSIISLPYENTFLSSNFVDFNVNNVYLGGLSAVWTPNASYGATANGNKCTSNIESYLESPLIDLRGISGAKISFSHGINYFENVAKAKEQTALQVREQDGTWNDVSIDYPLSLSNSYFSTNADLTEYVGKIIQVRFKYLATTTKPGRWQIKNLKIEEVVPVTLTSIAVSGQKTSFIQGATFSFGGTVTATYSDNTNKDVTDDATVSTPDLTSAGSKTVTVSYTEGGITKTTTYTITVSAPGGTSYTKVTSIPSNWSGTYIMVYEEDSSTGIVCKAGVDEASNYVTATISDGVITSDELSAYEVEISKYGNSNGNYSIKALGGTNANKYLQGNSSNSNGTVFVSTPDAATTFDDEFGTGGVVIIRNNGKVFAYNPANNNLRWRFFKATTAAEFKKPALYKKN